MTTRLDQGSCGGAKTTGLSTGQQNACEDVAYRLTSDGNCKVTHYSKGPTNAIMATSVNVGVAWRLFTPNAFHLTIHGVIVGSLEYLVKDTKVAILRCEDGGEVSGKAARVSGQVCARP